MKNKVSWKFAIHYWFHSMGHYFSLKRKINARTLIMKRNPSEIMKNEVCVNFLIFLFEMSATLGCFQHALMKKVN